ncbi:MAG TPA: ATP synthase subunit I [Bryobacteraceae bacterium]|nr:ATP synthase subunit I [Bryobacteraceae bacterium]
MTANSEAAHFDRAIERIRRAMLWLSVAGAAVAAGWKGWEWGLGFLAGAAVSLLNFVWLHQLVAALGEGARRPRKRLVWFLALRYVLLGVVGYVIVKFFGLNLAAGLIGLLVAAAAVILEIIYELIYARA